MICDRVQRIERDAATCASAALVVASHVAPARRLVARRNAPIHCTLYCQTVVERSGLGRNAIGALSAGVRCRRRIAVGRRRVAERNGGERLPRASACWLRASFFFFAATARGRQCGLAAARVREAALVKAATGAATSERASCDERNAS